MTPFNRLVVPTADLASFLRVEEGSELTFTELQSRLYDRLYRSGSVRMTDGTRAHRRRARDRKRKSGNKPTAAQLAAARRPRVRAR